MHRLSPAQSVLSSMLYIQALMLLMMALLLLKKLSRYRSMSLIQTPLPVPPFLYQFGGRPGVPAEVEEDIGCGKP